MVFDQEVWVKTQVTFHILNISTLFSAAISAGRSPIRGSTASEAIAARMFPLVTSLTAS